MVVVNCLVVGVGLVKVPSFVDVLGDWYTCRKSARCMLGIIDSFFDAFFLTYQEQNSYFLNFSGQMDVDFLSFQEQVPIWAPTRFNCLVLSMIQMLLS